MQNRNQNEYFTLLYFSRASKKEEENLAEQSLNLPSDTRERSPGPVFFTLI